MILGRSPCWLMRCTIADNDTSTLYFAWYVLLLIWVLSTVGSTVQVGEVQQQTVKFQTINYAGLDQIDSWTTEEVKQLVPVHGIVFMFYTCPKMTLHYTIDHKNNDCNGFPNFPLPRNYLKTQKNFCFSEMIPYLNPLGTVGIKNFIFNYGKSFC